MATGGTQVPGQTNVFGGSAPINELVATLADDPASINAARANMYPVGYGTPVSWKDMYTTAANGTKGGY